MSTPHYVWEDLRFPAAGVNPVGAADAPSRNTTDGLLEFAKAATNVITGQAQFPHRWAQGTTISPHIHLVGIVGVTGVQRWTFEYNAAKIGGVFAGSFTSDTKDFTVAAGLQHQLFSFTDIDMSIVVADAGVSAMMFWKLSRIGGNAADTYDDVARFLEFDIHYQVDALGSTLETSK